MDQYYVYQHEHPETGEVVYVGHGKKDRAWIRSPRNKEHKAWLCEMDNKGYIAEDYVSFLARGLSKKESCKVEWEWIDNLNPRFNKPFGVQSLKVTPEDYRYWLELRDKGLSYKKIAELTEYTTMTIHRALTGQTKNLEV